MEDNVQKLANAGQPEDSQIIHAAPGEMVVPPVISEQTQQMINQDLQSVGLNPAEYMVGQGSINNLTGLQEFGFLSKLFKKVKKVVKKVAPIAVNFIPGVGPVAKAALTAATGKASGLSTKEALLGGALSFAGGKMFGGAGGAGQGLGGSGRFSRIRGFFNPTEGTKGIFGGQIGPRIRGGLGNIFRPGQQIMPGQEPLVSEGDFTMVSGGEQNYQTNPLVTDLFQRGVITYQQGFDGMPGFFTNEAGDKFFTPEQVEAAYASQPSGLGRFFRRDPEDKGRTPQIIKSIGDILGFGGSSGPTETGRFFGRKTPEAIKGIEDKIRGLSGDNTGLALLAGLYGKATKEAAEKTEGGLRDIRLSVRPDLMPQQTFQGFDVGVRPGMQQGNAVFDVSVRNPENERFAFMILQSNDPNILSKLDDIDKQKFEHGLIMSGEFGLFTDATRGKNYMPSSAFQNIMRANATAQTKIPQMSYGGGMGFKELDMRMGGPSEGPGTETSDDIPAMLSDGEFVMTASANKGLGGFKIEKNKDSLTIFPTGKPDREQGFKNNDKLMKFFEDYQEMMS